MCVCAFGLKGEFDETDELSEYSIDNRKFNKYVINEEQNEHYPGRYYSFVKGNDLRATTIKQYHPFNQKTL